MRLSLITWFFCMSLPLVVNAAEDTKENIDSRNRSTAVALNYCRASFHRIRSNPSKRVLFEEREKILNNLNLNGIADEEVIRLYSAVLDEISQIQIDEKDRKFFKKKRNEDLLRSLGFHAVLFGTQLGTMQYMSALRTGANSWWDYRTMTYQRDLNIWKIEKNSINKVVSKSSQFLDVFWKMAQKKNIPDRWLVRGNDLDKLAEAMKEPNPVVRLRVLKRMEHFLESYPPYLYYVARTQQELGQLFAAAETYNELANIGAGHFRKDDMLAASTANLAAIQNYLHQPDAAKSAGEALRYSTDVWEANLVSAKVLAEHGMTDRAEDAILRNLDVDLEQSNSLLALLMLYHSSDQEEKLIERLNDATLIPKVAIPALLQIAVWLGPEKIPQLMKDHIARSMYAVQRSRFGPDEFLFAMGPGWEVQNAVMTLNIADLRITQPKISREDEHLEVIFRGIPESRIPFSAIGGNAGIVLNLTYPGTPPIHVHVKQIPSSRNHSFINRGAGIFSREETPAGQISIPNGAFRVASIEIGETHIVFYPVSSRLNVSEKSEPSENQEDQNSVSSEEKVASPKVEKSGDAPKIESAESKPTDVDDSKENDLKSTKTDIPKTKKEPTEDEVPGPPPERPLKRSAKLEK